jgi:hypothetical protein
MKKKVSNKKEIKIKKISPEVLIQKKISKEEEDLEKKILQEEDSIKEPKFREFIIPSIEVKESQVSIRQRPITNIERDSEILAVNLVEKEKKQEVVRGEYVSRGSDYNLVQLNKEKNIRPNLLQGEVLERSSERIGSFTSNLSRENIQVLGNDLSDEKKYTLKEDILGDEIKYRLKRLR